MIRRVLILASVVAALAGPAAADTLDVLKANTLTLTDAKGGVRTLVIEEDGRFQQTLPNGFWAAGPWAAEGGRFCFTPRGESTSCIPLPADKEVGDEWEIRGPTGVLAWTARIVEGRAKLDPNGGH